MFVGLFSQDGAGVTIRLRVIIALGPMVSLESSERTGVSTPDNTNQMEKRCGQDIHCPSSLLLDSMKQKPVVRTRAPDFAG